MIMYDEKLIIIVCICILNEHLKITEKNLLMIFFCTWPGLYFQINLHKTKMKCFVNHIMGLEMIFSSIFFSQV